MSERGLWEEDWVKGEIEFPWIRETEKKRKWLKQISHLLVVFCKRLVVLNVQCTVHCTDEHWTGFSTVREGFKNPSQGIRIFQMTLFDLRELKFSNLSQNWARSANLLFVILEILNAMDRHIEHCSSSFRQLNTFSVPTFTFAKCLNSYRPFLYVFSNHPNCGKQSHTVCIWILCEF